VHRRFARRFIAVCNGYGPDVVCQEFMAAVGDPGPAVTFCGVTLLRCQRRDGEPYGSSASPSRFNNLPDSSFSFTFNAAFRLGASTVPDSILSFDSTSS